MGDNSAIEWTDATWNPVTGCTKVSPGCKHCYGERLALRLHAMGNPRYRRGFDVTLHEDQLELPLRWKSPRRIFVNRRGWPCPPSGFCAGPSRIHAAAPSPEPGAVATSCAA